jgi:hypothetical protein
VPQRLLASFLRAGDRVMVLRTGASAATGGGAADGSAWVQATVLAAVGEHGSGNTRVGKCVFSHPALHMNRQTRVHADTVCVRVLHQRHV